MRSRRPTLRPTLGLRRGSRSWGLGMLRLRPAGRRRLLLTARTSEEDKGAREHGAKSRRGMRSERCGAPAWLQQTAGVVLLRYNVCKGGARQGRGSGAGGAGASCVCFCWSPRPHRSGIHRSTDALLFCMFYRRAADDAHHAVVRGANKSCLRAQQQGCLVADAALMRSIIIDDAAGRRPAVGTTPTPAGRRRRGRRRRNSSNARRRRPAPCARAARPPSYARARHDRAPSPTTDYE